uniref:Uncharacterized protein n=1 Tax=Arundo donax TaxID=35708 RepID=A0A0A9B311_ARUDO
MTLTMDTMGDFQKGHNVMFKVQGMNIAVMHRA